ncbi:ABC transporter permease [Streptomyces sp. NPDC001581]|uniref:ABC transporter permease n=1 Tax=Streptomyces sp. NPDC001581 TaxID=3154386 RepID=UPI00331D9F9E
MSVLTLKGPRWVTVRQHRRALWALPVAVAASLAVVLALRWWVGSPSGLRSDNPDGALRSAMDYAGMAMLLLPLLLGAFVAGPMVARELESGTYRLALTQSSTPRAWLAAKITVAAVAAVACPAALAGVYRLGWTPLDGTHQFTWWDRGPYEALGTVLVAYCLLGVAVGALVGQLVRRTLAAMAVTGLVTGLVMLLLGALRWSFLPVRTLTTSLGESRVPMPPGDTLMTDTGLVTASGVRAPEWCYARADRAGGCPEDLNVTGWYVDYHPASHYWPTQSIETAVVLVLAALTLWAAFAVLRTRHR